jgi:hypothetical protein
VDISFEQEKKRKQRDRCIEDLKEASVAGVEEKDHSEREAIAREYSLSKSESN